MFKKALYTLALMLLLTGTANAQPLKNFSGPSYIEQISEFYNNITRNWTDLPLGEIIITHILENKAGHPPIVIFESKEKDITLMITKRNSQLFLVNDYCTIFELRIVNEAGDIDSQFSSFLCLNSVDQTASLRIRGIDYTVVK